MLSSMCPSQKFTWGTVEAVTNCTENRARPQGHDRGLFFSRGVMMATSITARESARGVFCFFKSAAATLERVGRRANALRIPLLALSILALPQLAIATAFTPGNVVVWRVGDGTAALNANATAGFLEERTP